MMISTKRLRLVGGLWDSLWASSWCSLAMIKSINQINKKWAWNHPIWLSNKSYRSLSGGAFGSDDEDGGSSKWSFLIHFIGRLTQHLTQSPNASTDVQVDLVRTTSSSAFNKSKLKKRIWIREDLITKKMISRSKEEKEKRISSRSFFSSRP